MSHYSYNSGNRSNYKYLLPFLLSIALVLGVFIGFLVSLNSIGKNTVFVNPEYNKINNVLDFAEIYYVDSIDREKLQEEAIEELLSKLDPHSYYIAASELKSVNEDLQGNFEGIGVEFSIVDDTIMVVTPITGGPSEEIGIMAGDKIIEIDDSLVAGVGVKNQDVMAMLKGPKGTKVKVNILRAGSQNLSFTIKRDKIPLYSIDATFMIDDEIGFIKINRFSATTYDEFSKGLRQLQALGMKKLIIDLRQNPGGYLGAAVQIADELLDGKKLVVYTEGKNSKRMNYFAERPGYFEEGDLVVLIDQNSASASEILAGAVQDWDRGIIIGRRSFGKGLVQEQFTLKDQSAMRLTVARYYTPSGRSIQKPYSKSDDYYEEVYSRYDNGELLDVEKITIQDSTVYYTGILKREVFGGGGIMPDIFVPLDTTIVNFYVNKLRAHVPEFIYSYYGSNSDKYKSYANPTDFKKKYQVSDAFFNEFIQFAKAKGWDDDESKLPAYKAQLKIVLKAFLAKQLFKNDGYYTIMNELDPIVKEAVLQLKKGVEL
jgi:carboxyl-terminal processing protease